MATVGYTLSEAEERGLSARKVAIDSAFAGAFLHGDDYAGWAQWVVDTDSNKLTGATFVGREASSLLHASTIAIVGEIPLNRLGHSIPSFPTMSDICQVDGGVWPVRFGSVIKRSSNNEIRAEPHRYSLVQPVPKGVLRHNRASEKFT